MRRLPQALAAFDAALAMQPGNAHLLTNRGHVLRDLGRVADAADSFARAAAAMPTLAQAHAGHAAMALRLGRVAEALAAADRAVALLPDFAEAHSTRGAALASLGRWNEAIESYDRALARLPADRRALFGRAQALAARFDLAAAVAAFDAVLAHYPDDVAAHVAKAQVLRDLGWLAPALESVDAAIRLAPTHPIAQWERARILRGLQRPDDAREAFAAALAVLDDALAATPNDGMAHARRALVLNDMGRWEEAVQSADRAVALLPGNPDIWTNRGLFLRRLGRARDAEQSFRQALALRPDHPESLTHLALALSDLGEWEAALAELDRAVAIAPGFSRAQYNRALILLTLGRFAEGWDAGEVRWQMRELAMHFPWFGPMPSGPAADDARGADAAPLWQGETLDGRRLLVYAEQGFGDTIQFCRYVPLLAEREGAPVHVTLLVQPALRRLLADLPGVAHLVQDGDPYTSPDLRCPMLSLPQRFRTTLESIPPPPNLAPDPARRAYWRARLSAGTGPRVGIAWAGNPIHSDDHNRSLTLAMLAPLAGIGAKFVSLQKNVPARDAEALAEAAWLDNIGVELGDWADTAAAVADLDLVIAVDTAVAHLAGTLGVPTWTMLAFAPDWRWLLERADSPWYPSMRLFRQQAPGDWMSVLPDVQAALAAFVAAPA
jgi:tetratricopeptide (TPR) repeat protein